MLLCSRGKGKQIGLESYSSKVLDSCSSELLGESSVIRTCAKSIHKEVGIDIRFKSDTVYSLLEIDTFHSFIPDRCTSRLSPFTDQYIATSKLELTELTLLETHLKKIRKIKIKPAYI
ncbi:MAG: hypothetical protein ER33_08920 [Cyanobium sp. CACIAM 14]|nr:MAG: hypothetical protein ER33_08920 [Cyanobium sp. CACIAM 14]